MTLLSVVEVFLSITGILSLESYSMEQTSTSGQKLTNTNQGKLSIEDINGRLIVTDANNLVKLLAGYDDNGQVVVKMAQDGFDARTADDANLIFSSERNLFKIVDKLSAAFSFTTSAGATSVPVNISHNLGYKPVVFATATDVILNPFISSQRDLMVPYILVASSGVAGALVISAAISNRSITDTQIFFDVDIYTSAGQSCSGTINAYILRETVS